MRNFETEENTDEPEEGEDQEVIDKFVENCYDLSGIDAKIAEKISDLATEYFAKNSQGWTQLLNETSKLIDEKNEQDEEEFSGLLQAKLDEANDLIPN
jgi:hypothetical protein